MQIDQYRELSYPNGLSDTPTTLGRVPDNPACAGRGEGSLGICTYCGYDAGFLKHHHKLCQQNHETALANIRVRVGEALEVNEEFTELAHDVANMAHLGHVRPDEISPVLISAWTANMERHLDAEGISRKVENRLANFKNQFSLSQDALGGGSDFPVRLLDDE
jgi:hypothetical protein